MHAEPFTPDEIARLRSGFARTLLAPEEDETLTVVIFGWQTVCWKCEVPSYVWMEVDIAGPEVTAACRRADIRRALWDANPVPHALIGTVTTDKGGTYLGFTCPWCHSVQDSHHLTLELSRRLLDDEARIDKHHFRESSSSEVPELVLTPLQGSAFPETRARQFDQWRERADAIIAYVATEGRFPPKRGTYAGQDLHRARLSAREGTLTAERRAYLDVRLPGWLPDTTPVAEKFAAHLDEVVSLIATNGTFPRADGATAQERSQAAWLLGQRIRAALGKMEGWKRQALNATLPGWDGMGVPDWYGKVLLIRAAGLSTDDEALQAFLTASRAKLFTRSLDDDRIRILDELIPGWEEGPGFDEWWSGEIKAARKRMKDGEDAGRDMIHDVVRWPRQARFFRRLQDRFESGRIGSDELTRLRREFPTLDGFLGINGYERPGQRRRTFG